MASLHFLAFFFFFLFFFFFFILLQYKCVKWTLILLKVLSYITTLGPVYKYLYLDKFGNHGMPRKYCIISISHICPNLQFIIFFQKSCFLELVGNQLIDHSLIFTGGSLITLNHFQGFINIIK